MGKTFYSEGLKFECRRCSSCCRYSPGYVFLFNQDLKNLCKITGLPEIDFLRKYCREVTINGIKRISLKEKSNYDCIFWEEGGCVVYDYRPLQCRSYPFWGSNLISETAWNELEKNCPGVNKGKLHTKEQIERWLEIIEEESLVVPL